MDSCGLLTVTATVMTPAAMVTAPAVTDQRPRAGVSVAFATEMLFLRGADPWRPVAPVDDLLALVDLGRQLLDANKTRPDRVTTGDSRPGRRT